MAETPDTTVHVEPASTRSMLEWTPGLIKAARVMADAGNLELAADFWESALGDDRVRSAIATRTNGLVALPLSFEAVRGTRRLVKALEAGEDWWAAFPSTAVAQLLGWGIGLGVGLGQIVWTDRGATINRIVPTLKVWNPRHLRYDWQKRVWLVRIDGGADVVVTPGDGKWILYMPYGDNRPWAWGTWRAIALWTLLKQFAIQDWAYYSEKNAGGHKVASTPESFSKEKRKEVAQELFGLAANSVVALPAGVTLAQLEAAADTYQTFVAQKDAADLGVSVAILGQNLSTEVSGPVSTGATLHGRVLQVYIDGDAETWTTCAHDQALTWWAEFNFGNRDLAPWPKYDTSPPEDQKQRADVLKIVSEALNTLSNAGAPVDVRLLLEQYKVPLKDIEDIEQSGQVFKYHLDYGILTVNEIRARLGLGKVKGGNEPPKPVAQAAAPAEDKPEAADAKDADAEAEEGEKALVIHGVTPDALAEEARVERKERLAAEQRTDTRLMSHNEKLHELDVRLDLEQNDRREQAKLQDRHNTLVAAQVDGLTVSVRNVAGTVDALAQTVGSISATVAELSSKVDEALVTTRAGRTIRAQSGFVQGQLYADAVADASRDRAAKVLDEDLVAVLEAIDAGTSYDDIRTRLVKTYRGMSADKLQRLVEAAFTMAELGGRHAVNEDT